MWLCEATSLKAEADLCDWWFSDLVHLLDVDEQVFFERCKIQGRSSFLNRKAMELVLVSQPMEKKEPWNMMASGGSSRWPVR